MVNLVNVSRPAGKSTDYRFLKDEDGGKTYKATVDFDELDGGQPVIKFVVSEVDPATGSMFDDPAPHVVAEALFDQNLTLDPRLLEDPAFDVDEQVSAMLHSMIEARENRVAARERVAGLASKWKGRAALKLDAKPQPIPNDQVDVVPDMVAVSKP